MYLLTAATVKFLQGTEVKSSVWLETKIFRAHEKYQVMPGEALELHNHTAIAFYGKVMFHLDRKLPIVNLSETKFTSKRLKANVTIELKSSEPIDIDREITLKHNTATI